MTRLRLGSLLAVMSVGLNAAIILAAFACLVFGGFDADQFITVIGMVVPMLVSFVSAYVRHFTLGGSDTADERRPVAPGIVIMSIAAPILLTAIIVACMYLQASGRGPFSTFGQFSRIALALNAAFSAAVGVQLVVATSSPRGGANAA